MRYFVFVCLLGASASGKGRTPAEAGVAGVDSKTALPQAVVGNVATGFLDLGENVRVAPCSRSFLQAGKRLVCEQQRGEIQSLLEQLRKSQLHGRDEEKLKLLVEKNDSRVIPQLLELLKSAHTRSEPTTHHLPRVV